MRDLLGAMLFQWARLSGGVRRKQEEGWRGRGERHSASLEYLGVLWMAVVLGIGWTCQVNSERWHRGGVKADLEPHCRVGILAPAPPDPDLAGPQWLQHSALCLSGAPLEVTRAPPGRSWSPAEEA